MTFKVWFSSAQKCAQSAMIVEAFLKICNNNPLHAILSFADLVFEQVLFDE